MDAMTAIRNRRSTRQFNDKPIPREVLEEIVDAGRLAATARNEQPWEFVVVTERETLQQVGNATDYGRFIADAAACIIVFCHNTKYYLEDGSAASQNILVAAEAHGIAGCWVAGDKKAYVPRICQMFAVPPTFNLVSLIALGYSDAPKKRVPKRELSNVLHWEKFEG